ncbi:unnamed protein product [Hanseniaspora opuntiae]
MNSSHPPSRSRPSCCIFVASLSLKLDDKVLLQTIKQNFQKFGDIKLIKVLRDAKNRPYAFVQYFNTNDADVAVQSSKGMILNNRPCRVEKAKVNRTLFIKQLKIPSPNKFNIELVINEFSKHGEIEQVISMVDFINLVKENKIEQPKDNVKSLIKEHVDIFQKEPTGSLNDNCWFLQFAYREDAITAHALYQNIKDEYLVHWAENIDLSNASEETYNLAHKFKHLINYDTNQSASITTHNTNLEIDVYSIFVGQLTQSCTHEALYEKFSKHGAITNLKLFTRNPKNCYAFITYSNNRSAGSAIETENHTYFNNKSIHVQYRELQHDNAESKHKQNRAQHKKQFNEPTSCTDQKNYERNGQYNMYQGNSRSNMNSSGSIYSPNQQIPYGYNDGGMPMLYNYSNQSDSHSSKTGSLSSLYSSSSTPNSVMSTNKLYPGSNPYQNMPYSRNSVDFSNTYPEEKKPVSSMINSLYNDVGPPMYPPPFP